MFCKDVARNDSNKSEANLSGKLKALSTIDEISPLRSVKVWNQRRLHRKQTSVSKIKIEQVTNLSKENSQRT